MASETISEHLKFPGGACPQTPLVLHAYACIHTNHADIHVTPFLKIMAMGLFQQWYLENSSSSRCDFSTKVMLITSRSSTSTQCLHSFKFALVNKIHSQHCGCCPLCRMPFSEFVCMCLIPKPKTAVIGLGGRLVHTWNHEMIGMDG